MKSFSLLKLVLIVAVAVGTAGCGKKSEEKKSGKTETNSATGQQVSVTSNTAIKAQPLNNSQFSLVGVWLGTSYLDEQALNEKLAALESEEARQNLMTKAQTFYSMWMAAQFNEDRTMEVDVEITLPSGEMLEDQATGSWEASLGEENSLIVKTIEHRGEKTETSTKRYVIVDQDHISLVPGVAEELQDLQPFVIFQRQSDEEVPLSAQADAVDRLK